MLGRGGAVGGRSTRGASGRWSLSAGPRSGRRLTHPPHLIARPASGGGQELEARRGAKWGRTQRQRQRGRLQSGAARAASSRRPAARVGWRAPAGRVNSCARGIAAAASAAAAAIRYSATRRRACQSLDSTRERTMGARRAALGADGQQHK